MTHQEVLEKMLDEFAASADRWIMVSRTYANMGTYHLMAQQAPPHGHPKRLMSIDFRYSVNHMEWGATKNSGLFQDANTKLYSVITEWDQLLTDLQEWAQLGEN